MKKSKRGYLIAGLIGGAAWIITIILLSLESYFPEGLYFSLLFSIGLPYFLVGQLFIIAGYKTAAYIFPVIFASLAVYCLLGVLIYYLIHKIKLYIKNKK